MVSGKALHQQAPLLPYQQQRYSALNEYARQQYELVVQTALQWRQQTDGQATAQHLAQQLAKQLGSEQLSAVQPQATWLWQRLHQPPPQATPPDALQVALHGRRRPHHCRDHDCSCRWS